MSRIIANNIRHNDATIDSITLDSAGNVSVPGNLSVTGTSTLTGNTTVTGSLTANGIAYPSAGPLSNRNLIINGAMQVAQRGTSFTAATSGAFTLDRWEFARSTSGVFDVIQSSVAPAGFRSSLKVDCTTTSTPTTTQETFIRHKLEAQDLQHLQYGTSGAQSITFSFWVRSNKTGDYGLRFSQEDASPVRQYVTTYTISSANTWEHKTITISGDAAGTINNDNGEGLQIRFYLQAGPDRAGTPAETWDTDTDNRATDLNLGDSTDNEWLLTGVQLEVGSVATPFEHRSYGDELQRCQRYYQMSFTNNPGTTNTSTEGEVMSGGMANISTTSHTGAAHIQFQPNMRATPTITTFDKASPRNTDTLHRQTFGQTGSNNNTATVANANQQGFSVWSQSGGSASGIIFHYTAEAEL